MAEHSLLSDGVTLYNPDTWLDKEAAARLAGTTTRTIERWASAGLLIPLYFRPDYKRRVAVFSKEDIIEAKKKSEERAVPARREPTAPTSAYNGHVGQALVPTARRAPTISTIMNVPLDKKIYLTRAKASAYSGLPIAVLERLVEKKKITRFDHRLWFVRRRDLDKL